jgi:hypothetical protein
MKKHKQLTQNQPIKPQKKEKENTLKTEIKQTNQKKEAIQAIPQLMKQEQ